MLLRWKEAKYSDISGYQFFKRLREKSLGYIALAKIQR